MDAIIPLDLPTFPGRRSELVGSGKLRGPEDVAFDPRSNLIYTGCANGWIKLVTVNDSASSSVVRKWVKTSGRPLGIAFGHRHEVIVADPKKVNLFCLLVGNICIFFSFKQIRNLV